MTTGFCNKCGFSGQVGEFGQHLRPSDGRACSYMAGSPLAKPHPAPSPSEVGPEVVERMIALVRRVAGGESFWVEETEAEARAIVALLPEPVDVNEQYARHLIREQGWQDEREIGSEAVVRMIAMARRARALEKEAGR